jgi:hypothetical protein
MAARAGIAPKCDGRHILSKPEHTWQRIADQAKKKT